MERSKFINRFENANRTLDKEWINAVLTKADDMGLKYHEQRGHENLIIDMEEMAELSQQISKYIRGKGDYYSLIEEMADVQVCLYHLQNLYNISDEQLNRAVNVKIQRCEQRLQNLEEQ